MEDKIFSLYEINNLIAGVISDNLSNNYWIVSEIARISENSSGHCYLELVEKDAVSDTVLAQAKAMVWSRNYKMLKTYFETATGRRLERGMKILFKASVQFHPLYGLSFHIVDIDPGYTIGDLALKKMQVVKKLKEEGVFELNKIIQMPLVVQRIAVISSEGAAGYSDFMAHLAENPYGYRFEVTLFQTLMQGEKAEASIIAALDAIFDNIEKYDAVTIIRGGGGQVDLSCFDSYLLASHIAQFPIPVLSGIGHERDDSVVDMVAHTRLKTPTAVAAFVIDRANMFEVHVDECLQMVVDYCSEVTISERERLRSVTQVLPLIAKDIINYQKQKVRNEMLQVFNFSAQKISLQKTMLANLQHSVTAEAHKQLFVTGNQLEGMMMKGKRASTDVLSRSEAVLDKYLQVAQWANPENVLKRGFSITRIHGKIVNSEKELCSDDVVETTLAQGKFRSKVL